MFTLDTTTLHRPLGFSFGTARGADGAAGWLGVERSGGRFHAGGLAGLGQSGAAAAGIWPPDGAGDATATFNRKQLARGGGCVRGVAFVASPRAAAHPANAAAVATVADLAAGASGHARHELLVESLPGAGSIALAEAITGATAGGADALATLIQSPQPSDRAAITVSARGIVDGQRVSVLALAAGSPVVPRREPIRLLLLTDATLDPPTLALLWQEVTAHTVASIAGMQVAQPGDWLLALASGALGMAPIDTGSLGATTLQVGITAVAQAVVQQLLQRAFDPARVVQITVSSAPDATQAAAAAEQLAADGELRTRLGASRGDGTQDEQVRRRTTELLASVAPGARVAFAGREDMAALRVDLRAGGAAATRWTAVASA